MSEAAWSISYRSIFSPDTIVRAYDSEIVARRVFDELVAMTSITQAELFGPTGLSLDFHSVPNRGDRANG